MAVLTVGQGGNFSTLKGAWDSAANGDTLRLVSDISSAGDVFYFSKNNIVIDGQGYWLRTTSTGSGMLLSHSVGTRILNLNMEATGSARTGTYGAGISVGPGAKYTLVQGAEITGYVQAGVNTGHRGYGWSQGPGTFKAGEYVWVDECFLHEFDVIGSFNNDGSCISFLAPEAVPGSQPQWWANMLTTVQVPQEGTTTQSRTAANLSFVATNNRCEDYNQPGTQIDTDQNGIIIDEWRGSFTPTADNYCTINPGRWGLIENNRIRNMRGSAARVFNSSDDAGICPHVMRHNTAYNVGQRTVAQAGYEISIAYSFASHNAGMDNPQNQQRYDALCIHNVVHTAGSGYGVAFSTNHPNANDAHNVTFRDNAAFNIFDGDIGHPNWVGPVITAAPQLESLIDTTRYYPNPGSPLIGAAGANAALLDADGVTRPNPASLGASEPQGSPITIVSGNCNVGPAPGGLTQIGFIVATNDTATLSVRWNDVGTTAPYTEGPETFSGTGGTNHSHIVTGLQPGTTYYFNVTATNALSNDSAIYSCTTLEDTPAVEPTTITINLIG